MSKIDTVLFDFDGTLMDTNQIIMDSWQHTFRAVTGKEGDPAVIVKTYGEPLRSTMHDFFGGDAEEVEKNLNLYRSFQEGIFEDSIKLFPGVMEMLKDLKAAGFTVAMVTSRLAKTTYEAIKGLGIGELLDGVITADDTTAHKPDPTPINIMLEKLGKKPDQAIMVGDTWMDLGCAKNAGVKNVLVGWSLALPPEEATGERSADYVIYEAGELLGLIEKINQE